MLKRIVKNIFFKRRKAKKSFEIERLGINVIIKSKLVADGYNTVDHFSILEGKEIRLGLYSTISSHCVIRGPVEIGPFTQIGPNVSIFSRNHPADSLTINVSSHFCDGKRKRIQSELEKKVTIGADVWIGAGAIILPGVDIGHGSIVAAGSVVNKDVESYSIVGGVTAKRLRNRFSDEMKELLLKSQWWNKSSKELVLYKDLFMKKHIDINDLQELL